MSSRGRAGVEGKRGRKKVRVGVEVGTARCCLRLAGGPGSRAGGREGEGTDQEGKITF